MSTKGLIGLLLCLPVCALAENVSDLRNLGGGIYSMKIDGNTYTAMPEADKKQLVADLENMAKELAEAKKLVARQTALSNQYEDLRNKYAALTSEYSTLADNSIQLNGRYAAAADKLVTLNQSYSKLGHDYDALAEKYRQIAIRAVPREALDIGLGAVSTTNTTRGVVMVGAGTHILNAGVRAWLFGGQNNFGVILGTSF